MIEIRPLAHLELADFQRVAGGYRSTHKYAVEWQEADGQAAFCLRRAALERPLVKRWDPWDEETGARYAAALAAGYSYGAYADGELVGLVLAEPAWWNRSLWVWEFHVAAGWQRQGIGRTLMERLAQQGRSAGLRALVCETQNTNAGAIAAYYRLDFSLQGIDLSYYSNQDYPDGEIALFFKRRLDMP